MARYFGLPSSVWKRRAVRNPGIARRSRICSSSYQRWNSVSCAASMSVINKSNPGFVIAEPHRLEDRRCFTPRKSAMGSLNYELCGNGPHVVLLHPIGLDLSFLSPAASILRQEFTVLTLDQRGHGESRMVCR